MKLKTEISNKHWGTFKKSVPANDFIFGDDIVSINPIWVLDDDGFKNHFGTLDRSEVTFNSLFYRSDEFTSTHEGMHILFSGCSHVYGIGLSDSEMWSRKLYYLIKDKIKVSGYFNVSLPGSSLIHQVLNIIRYIDKYGKPDYIFLGIPSIERRYGYCNDTKSYRMNSFTTNQDTVSGIEMREDFKLQCFLNYMLFEKICKLNNIKLISFYQEFPISKDFSILDSYETYHSLSYLELNEFMYEYHVNNKDDKNYLEARDVGYHYGTAANIFIANKMFEIFEGAA